MTIQAALKFQKTYSAKLPVLLGWNLGADHAE